jgi:predicted RNA-binding Zn-ribbon protein involved in translation (DUF1610 family)
MKTKRKKAVDRKEYFHELRLKGLCMMCGEEYLRVYGKKFRCPKCGDRIA